MEHFSVLTDYRQQSKVDHLLSDILLLTICAIIAGAEGWEDIEDFGNDRLDWLKTVGDFKNGIPSDDTIARTVSLIDPKEFQQCFIKWMADCHEVTDGKVVAIDGKTVRRSFDKTKRRGAIHMVSAFCTANSVVLGQLKVDEKSNEITAIPELLDLLQIRGCLVTIDAMGCQRHIAKKIIDKKANYLLAVKGNQGKLLKSFEEHFPVKKLQNWQGDQYITREKSHGRIENRLYVVSDLFDEFVNRSFDWKGMKTLGVAMTFREFKGETPDLSDVCIRYYISSAKLTAKRLAEATREHWHIENKLHWKLDVAMREDDCRIRRGNTAQLLSGFRHIAINLLSKVEFRGGLRKKQRKALSSSSFISKALSVENFS